jgi:hypothetical protein
MQKVKVFLSFFVVAESKYGSMIFGFNWCRICKSKQKQVKVFLMVQNGPGFMDSLVYSLIKLWWYQEQDKWLNIDEILLCVLISIHMDITS